MFTINTFRGKYRFLSNFYYAEVNYEGIRYPTVEHAYQAAKTLSTDIRLKISKTDTPGAAKHLGRKGLLRPN